VVTTNILTRVRHIQYEFSQGRFEKGTGFTLEYGDKQFLVTVSHIFRYRTNGEKLSIGLFHKGNWETLEVTIYLHENVNVDVALLSLPHDISNKLPVSPTTADMALGADFYFLGFPFGMMMDDQGINDGFPIPYVKKGCLSGLPLKEKGVEKLYLDAINNTGFSGGPVVFYGINDMHLPLNNRVVRIAGVVKGYIPNIVKFTTQLAEELEFAENSGLVEVHSIDHVLQIAKREGFV
jgi:hypothetical protein